MDAGRHPDHRGEPARLDDAREVAEALDGELTDFYLGFGQYDLVAVADVPADETYALFAPEWRAAGR